MSLDVCGAAFAMSEAGFFLHLKGVTVNGIVIGLLVGLGLMSHFIPPGVY